MDVEYITRPEHEEFAKRMDSENQRRDDENNRQNKRLEKLEAATSKIESLTVAIEKMSVSIGVMATEIKNQGEHLERLEAKPGKKWETLVADIVKLVVAAVVGGVIAKLGI